MSLYSIIRSLLFCLDAEDAHGLAIHALKASPRFLLRGYDDSLLHTTLTTKAGALSFPNPVGLAAGFDKQAEVIAPILDLGFGFTEIGSITPLPQAGNPRPRLFRVPEAKAVINRFGFNSEGIEACRTRITAYRADATPRAGLLGINVGKNKETEDAAADYIKGIRAFAPLADYLTANISSPNTPGLRDLQRREPLQNLLTQIVAARNEGTHKPPLFIKIAPDLSDEQKEDIAELSLTSGIDGIIIGNTTITRPPEIPAALAQEAGGLSGAPLRTLSTRVLADIYRLTKGQIPLIGCGGIASGADAYDKIRAGASLVQLYSAMVYEGIGLAARINRELAVLLKRDGFKSVNEAVGTNG